MNAERRIQPVRKVLEPIGDTRADWQVICEIATAMGKKEFFDYKTAEEIWNEVRVVWPAGNGITYSRLQQGGLQWPCTSADHPGTSILHQQTFTIGKTAKLEPVEYRPTKETVEANYPFLLITGRTLYHFNAGTMTARTKNIELQATDFLDVHPQDAEKLGVCNGQRVRIRSRYGEATLPVRLSDKMRCGEVFATFHTPELFLNRVTGAHCDKFTQTPEYKITAVRLEQM